MSHSYTREASNKKKNKRRRWRITYTLIEGDPPKRRAEKPAKAKAATTPKGKPSKRRKSKSASTQSSFSFGG